MARTHLASIIHKGAACGLTWDTGACDKTADRSKVDCKACKRTEQWRVLGGIADAEAELRRHPEEPQG